MSLSLKMMYPPVQLPRYQTGISPNGGVPSYDFGFYSVDDVDDVGSLDNCPEVYNPLQLDYDSDTEGDACDEDDDNDLVIDGLVCVASRVRLGVK